MLLSIVTGTYNRHKQLTAMVESARLCLPVGIDYEFVIVDGGSTDGTIEWALQQPDARLIQQGELLGAIRAFDAGAEAARGEYVLFANDDILFEAHSILPAIVYLEDHADTGAVAFQDDRMAPGKAGRGVQTMPVRVGERDRHLVYAQVGLFRKWLGDVCGWWGSHDSIMANGAGTYGGDNFLSARIYEHGYAIAIVPGCVVHDTVHEDALRKHNYRREQDRPAAYYRRYPKPPVWGSIRVDAAEQGERLRVLYMPIFEKGYWHQRAVKRGLRDAFGRVGLVCEVDYVNTRYDLAALANAFQPHLLVMQAHDYTSIPLDDLIAARAAAPGMVVVNWNGDVWSKGLTSPEMLAYLRHVDLQLTVNANALKTYQDAGIPAAYWQVAWEPLTGDLPVMPAHDVVFLANAYSEQRQQMESVLRTLRGVDVGLYGGGWKHANGITTYDFATGAALYRNSRIAIGDNQYPDERGFVSNRLFEALANGAFLLHQTVAGLEELTGLQDGVHYVSWSDLQDLHRKVRYWLAPRNQERRMRIAGAGQVFVLQHHGFDNRVDELLNVLLPKVTYEPA